jgi:hypothetical protein
VPPDALLTGIAVLTLLSGLSDDGPLLVAVDDAQWLDRGSLDALAFAARRLESERLVLLLGVRGNVPPTGFDRDFPELPLQPLGSADASRLLDAQPHPPRGRAREQVLAQAAGNPMALIELSKVIAADPAAGRTWETEPIPLTDRLTANVFPWHALSSFESSTLVKNGTGLSGTSGARSLAMGSAISSSAASHPKNCRKAWYCWRAQRCSCPAAMRPTAGHLGY